MQTITQVIEAQGITATCEYQGQETDNEGNGRSWHYDSWKVTLCDNKRHTLTTPFKMGLGHHGKEPSAAEVLGSLVLDASVMQYGDFCEWASDMGYDEDSRKAEAIYNACLKVAARLRRFLSVDPSTIDISDF